MSLSRAEAREPRRLPGPALLSCATCVHAGYRLEAARAPFRSLCTRQAYVHGCGCTYVCMHACAYACTHTLLPPGPRMPFSSRRIARAWMGRPVMCAQIQKPVPMMTTSLVCVCVCVYQHVCIKFFLSWARGPVMRADTVRPAIYACHICVLSYVRTCMHAYMHTHTHACLPVHVHTCQIRSWPWRPRRWPAPRTCRPPRCKWWCGRAMRPNWRLPRLVGGP